MNKNTYPLSQLSAITLTGENSQSFLQGQLTCDVNALKSPGDYSLGTCCDHKGRMLANFWLLKREYDYLIVLPKDLQETVISHLHKYAMFSKVTVAKSEDICICATDNVEIDTLKKARSDNQIIISLPNPKRHLIISENKLCETERKDGDTAWEKENINDKFAILSSKTSLLFTPQMINLETLGGVSFTKGCYVGQEIVARTQHLGKLKRHLQRIQFENEKPLQPGDPLLNENGEKVGTIVNAIFNDGKVDALAVIEDRALNAVFRA